MDTPEEMWTAYLAAAPEVADARISYTAWHFCDNQQSADELAELALRGVKRATAGEGDGSLAYWREAHWAAFTRELEMAGRRPELDMPVVCERFDVVYPR